MQHIGSKNEKYFKVVNESFNSKVDQLLISINSLILSCPFIISPSLHHCIKQRRPKEYIKLRPISPSYFFFGPGFFVCLPKKIQASILDHEK